MHVFILITLILFSCASLAFEVMDDAGRVFQADRPYERIISLSPHVTELLYEIGASSSIIGAVAFSDYPEEAKQILRVGSSDAIDMETIVALQPDLVIGWKTGNPQRFVDKLQALGLRVYLSEIENVADIPASLRKFGVLTGKKELAGLASAQFEQRMEKLRLRYHDRPEFLYFHQIWHSPLMTVNGSHLISDALEYCNGRNGFADQPMMTPNVSIESVVQMNPDVIVISQVPETAELWKEKWLAWKNLPAVRNNRIITVHPDFFRRPTSRLLTGIERVCNEIYPE